jgi:hypothetical protein
MSAVREKLSFAVDHPAVLSLRFGLADARQTAEGFGSVVLLRHFGYQLRPRRSPMTIRPKWRQRAAAICLIIAAMATTVVMVIPGIATTPASLPTGP